MNKFNICNQLYLVEQNENEKENRGLGFIKDNIRYDFSRHDTGQNLDIYLDDGDKTLHVYHDNEWFYSRYKFNDKGKKFGYLIDGPWIKIIENQFKEWEKKLLEYEANKLLQQQLENTQKIVEEQNKIKYFTEKFSNI